MNLQSRIDLLIKLGDHMRGNSESWLNSKKKATAENPWFIPEFIDLAVKNIVEKFLQENILKHWAAHYKVRIDTQTKKSVGIVMASNLPLVGFHDLMAVFICGHEAVIKPSSKDQALLKHLVDVLKSFSEEIDPLIRFEELLKNCDAYIATGSNNTSRYFEYYFSKYPHIIRRNKSSVAILTGKEAKVELEKLADDVYQFFGLGCRNVTKIYVPKNYDFVSLLTSFKKYDWLADHHKYKNNYDYNLALHILNKKFYMTNGSIILIEDPSIFSPISQLNYEYYSELDHLKSSLNNNNEIQALIGNTEVPFGQAQSPSITDYADKIDTMAFLSSL